MPAGVLVIAGRSPNTVFTVTKRDPILLLLVAVVCPLATGGCDSNDKIVKYRVPKPELVYRENHAPAPDRTLAAIVLWKKTSWFFKLSGPADSIGPHFGAFTNFLGTLKFEPAASEVNFDRLMAEAQQAQPPPTAPAAAGPTWAKPADWAEQPRTAMRLGNFTAGDGQAEITLMTFPGDVGGLLANVNRWRDQSGLPPVDAAGLASATERVSVAGPPAPLVEAVGDKHGSISVDHPVGNQTWFYKITGPSAVVTTEKGAFMGFLQSIRFPKP